MTPVTDNLSVLREQADGCRLHTAGALNVFSVDVEDYYHVSGFDRHISRASWDAYESRVEVNTRRIIGLLERQRVRATFFVLGWVARRYPRLIREIHDAGHEIGSHSFWHRLVYQQTPTEFRADLVQSRQTLEDIIGTPVIAYRAPSFSITRKSLWALEILAEEGFEFDSSVFPIHHDRYGIPTARRSPHRLQTEAGFISEFPGTVWRLGGINFPVSGGGYFRLYPGWLKRYCLASINKGGRPFMFYIHPWELDPDQPRMSVGTIVGRWRHYQNLHTTERKLEALLNRFHFGTLSQSILANAETMETVQATSLAD